MTEPLRYNKPPPNGWILRNGWHMPVKPCTRGHMAPINAFNHCMQCVREYRKERGHFSESSKRWREKNKELSNANRREWNRRNPKRNMINVCRMYAKRRGIPFDLEQSDFEIPDKCPIFGMPLERGIGSRHDASPSIDRIVPQLGYVRGNVVVISWRANRLKQDATIDEMKSIVAFYEKILKD